MEFAKNVIFNQLQGLSMYSKCNSNSFLWKIWSRWLSFIPSELNDSAESFPYWHLQIPLVSLSAHKGNEGNMKGNNKLLHTFSLSWDEKENYGKGIWKLDYWRTVGTCLSVSKCQSVKLIFDSTLLKTMNTFTSSQAKRLNSFTSSLL